MRGIGLILCLAAAGRVEEKGKYLLSFSGKEAGAEEFRLESFDDGQTVLHARSKVEVAVQGKTQTVTMDAMLTLDRAGKPLRYAGLETAGGRERRSKVEWKDGAAWPEPRRSVKTQADFVLDSNVWSQLIPIVRRFEGPKKRLKVYSPATQADVDLSIEEKGEVTLRGKEASFRARELLLTLGSTGWTVHVDGEKRVVRISNPVSGALAELEGFEGLVPQPRGAEIRRPETVLESDVTFPSGSVTLAGSITLLRGSTAAPWVVLISGPLDRNGGLLQSVAYALSAAGVSVLRYDDRGSGRSGGDSATAKLSDLTADVEAAVAYLRSRGDVGTIGLVGHGEGAVLAPIVATRDPAIRAVFLLAGPSTPLDQVLLEQIGLRMRESGAKEESIAPLVESQKRVFRRIRESKEDWLEIDERKTFVGRLREHFNHDPAAQVAKVKAPLVVFQGGKDKEVRPAHAEALARACAGSELRVFGGLDHSFMKPEGKPGEPVDPEFLGVLAERVGALLR